MMLIMTVRRKTLQLGETTRTLCPVVKVSMNFTSSWIADVHTYSIKLFPWEEHTEAVRMREMKMESTAELN